MISVFFEYGNHGFVVASQIPRLMERMDLDLLSGSLTLALLCLFSWLMLLLLGGSSYFSAVVSFFVSGSHLQSSMMKKIRQPATEMKKVKMQETTISSIALSNLSK